MRDTVIQSIHGAVPYDIPLLLADPDYFRIRYTCAAGPRRLAFQTRPEGVHRCTAFDKAAISAPYGEHHRRRFNPRLSEKGNTAGSARSVGGHRNSTAITLGTHRTLSTAELEAGYGADIVSRYRFINHDCHGSDLVANREIGNSAPVKINHHVYEANFRIGIGSIFPHPLKGFGGGGKILFPGIADFESIFQHHLK